MLWGEYDISSAVAENNDVADQSDLPVSPERDPGGDLAV